MKPKRIQLMRTKGWRKPDGVLSCCRPGIRGNPFTGEKAVEAFRLWAKMIATNRSDAVIAMMTVYDHLGYVPVAPSMMPVIGDPAYPQKFRNALRDARGKDCGCYCALDAECHVDTVIELVNKQN